MKKRPVTLRVQILSALLFLTLTATLTVSFAAWHVCRNKIEENYRSTYKTNLQTYNSILRDKLQSLNDLARSIFLDEEFLAVLKTPNDWESPYYRTSEELAVARSCRQFEAQSSLL